MLTGITWPEADTVSDRVVGCPLACRCYCCNKKVGFTGIECRCGFVYCGTHRYPDQHSCTFDFKTHDRENLQKVVMGGGEFSKIDHL